MPDDNLRQEIRELRSEVDALHRRIDTLESAIDDEALPNASAAATLDSTQGRVQSKESDNDDPETAPSSGRLAQDPGSTPPQPDSAEKNRLSGTLDDWERDVGITWLGRVGSVALVVGVVFFIRVAIEAGILGPLGRVIAGTVGGSALLAGGRYAASHRGYQRWGRLTAGTGLAIAFFSIYAAYGFTSYRVAIGTPLWTVLVGLTALIGATIAVSVSDAAPLVAGEAFLLGYATAYLALDSGSFVVTPAYVLVLTLGLVGVASLRPWSRHVVASVPLTYGLVGAWLADFDPAWGIVAGVVVALFAVYVGGNYALRRRVAPGVQQSWTLTALTPLNATLAAAFLEWTVRRWVPDLSVAGLGVGGVAVALIGVYVLTAHRDVSHDTSAGTAAAVFLGLSAVLAAGTFAATVSLLAILCVAVAVASYADLDAVHTGAHLVAVGTVLKLLAVDARELPGLTLSDPLITATGRPAAFLLVIAILYGLAWWFREETFTVPTRDDHIGLSLPYLLTATALTVVGLGLDLSGFGLSIAWAVFGAVLLGGGLISDLRSFRAQGVAVFGVTTAKVFLFDTQGLGTVARSISFLVLGATLLAASYAYARRQGDRPLDRLIDI